MSLEEPPLMAQPCQDTPRSRRAGHCQLWGHSRAAKGAGQSCQAAGVRPAPQLVAAPLEEQEQADELAV